jgi:hypothetical protein
VGIRPVVSRRTRGRSSHEPKDEDTGATQEVPHAFLDCRRIPHALLHRRTFVEKHNSKDGDQQEAQLVHRGDR